MAQNKQTQKRGNQTPRNNRRLPLPHKPRRHPQHRCYRTAPWQQQPPHSHMMGMRSPTQAQLSQQQHSSQAQHMMLPGMMQQQPPPSHMSSRGASVGDMMRQQNSSASHSMHGGGGPHVGSGAGAGSIHPHRRRTSASSLGDVGQSSRSYPSHHHPMQQIHGAQPPTMVNSHLDRSLTPINPIAVLSLPKKIIPSISFVF